MAMNRIGERIKQLRLEANMTQKALAKKLGVAESFINEIETGRKVVNESLINRMTKVFGKDVDNNSYSEDIKEIKEPIYENQRRNNTQKKEDVNLVWDNALSSILKNVPIYTIDLKKPVGLRQLPVISNKIEGFAQDKVFFLKIDSDDLQGFRIEKGDIAFAHFVQEAANNDICIIEHNGERLLRQIKKLDNNKVLLISNERSLRTETVNLKEIKFIAKLTKIEIEL